MLPTAVFITDVAF